MLRAVLAGLERRATHEWGHLGTKTTASGVRCVGFVPQVGSAAWLHRFHPGTNASEIDAAEARIGRPIPSRWREALLVNNGVLLFITKCSLYGILPGNLKVRSIEDPRPFSIEDANTYQRPQGQLVTSDDFVIGGSSAGDGALYLLRADESVAKVSRDGETIAATWSDPGAMLKDEYTLFGSLHDRDGTYHSTA